MKPTEKGIQLTARDEFVVVGQAYTKSRKRMDDVRAVNEALGHLQQEEVKGESPSWLLAKADYLGHLAALGTVEAFYEKLQDREDSGSYCENPSWEYSRLCRLESTASSLAFAIQEAMGVPKK